MTDILTTRHSSVFNPLDFAHIPIHVIGAGATGSRVWLNLVELGLTRIIAHDFDRIESHNIANQIFMNSQIGMPKVAALCEYYKMKTGEHPPAEMEFKTARVSNMTHNTLDFESSIVFLLTDTMSSRKEIMALMVGSERKPIAVIETRLASSYGDVNVINPHDSHQLAQWYDSLVDDDSPTETTACGGSISVGSTANLIASMAVWQMINTLIDPLSVTPSANIHLKPMMLTLGRTEYV